MDGRKRTVQIKFRVTEAERDLILEKMKLVPTRNMAAYLRKIPIAIVMSISRFRSCAGMCREEASGHHLTFSVC